MEFFEFKSNYKDFVVEEVLKETPAGEGDYIYIFFQKKGKTTFDIAFHLAKAFGVSKNQIGVAGLKDKFGVTRQRFSFPSRYVRARQKEKFLSKILSKKGRILYMTYGYQPLQITHNLGNKFYMVLRNKFGNNSQELRAAEYSLQRMQEKGFSNYFGEQRFGANKNNRKLGKDLILGKTTQKNLSQLSRKELKFKIQAFASFMFNSYLKFREERNKVGEVISGDVLREGVPTGPVFGYDLELPTGKALELEEKTLRKYGLNWKHLENFKYFEIYGLRRKIYIIPQEFVYKFGKHKDLYLEFFLPSGCYASSLYFQLERNMRGRLK